MLAQVLLEQGKASTTLAVITEQLKTLLNTANDHELRIRSLERFRWTLGGLALAGGAASTLLGYLLGHGHP